MVEGLKHDDLFAFQKFEKWRLQGVIRFCHRPIDEHKNNIYERKVLKTSTHKS